MFHKSLFIREASCGEGGGKQDMIKGSLSFLYIVRRNIPEMKEVDAMFSG